MKTFIAATALIIATSANAGFTPPPFSMAALDAQAKENTSTDTQIAGLVGGPMGVGALELQVEVEKNQVTDVIYREVVAGWTWGGA